MLFYKFFISIKCSKAEEKKPELLSQVAICSTSCCYSQPILLTERPFQNTSFTVFPEETEKSKVCINISKLIQKYVYLPKFPFFLNDGCYIKTLMYPEDLYRITNVNICLVKRLTNMKIDIILNKKYYNEILEVYEMLINSNFNDQIFILTLNNLNRKISNIVKEVNTVLLTFKVENDGDEEEKDDEEEEEEEGGDDEEEEEEEDDEGKEKLIMFKKIESYVDFPDVIRDEYVETFISKFQMNDLLKTCKMLNAKFNEKLVMLKQMEIRIKARINKYFDMNPGFCEIKPFNTEDKYYIREEHYFAVIYKNLKSLISKLKPSLKSQDARAEKIFSLRKEYIQFDNNLFQLEERINNKINEINCQ